MTTITISKDLMKKKDLMLVSRLQYEDLLRRSKMVPEPQQLWKSATKNKFFKSYRKSDTTYDKV